MNNTYLNNTKYVFFKHKWFVHKSSLICIPNTRRLLEFKHSVNLIYWEHFEKKVLSLLKFLYCTSNYNLLKFLTNLIIFNWSICWGWLAQSGEHSLTTPAIRVWIQVEPRLCLWQNKNATLIFQKSYSNKITGQRQISTLSIIGKKELVTWTNWP